MSNTIRREITNPNKIKAHSTKINLRFVCSNLLLKYIYIEIQNIIKVITNKNIGLSKIGIDDILLL